MEESNSSWRNNKSSIDRLPDEVLISIVSLLPVKQAARTSVVARRWRHLWLFNPILDFDGSERVHESENRSIILLELERRKFVGWVNRVVSLHSRESIDEFRVSFDLDHANANDIDRWIEFAFKKRVKRLDLNMMQSRSSARSECWRYTFPHPSRFLRITNCESLVSLRLAGVHITGAVLELFILICPLLEEIYVKIAYDCEGLGLSCLATRLRRLAMINCQYFARLEICTPNLVLSFLRS